MAIINIELKSFNDVHLAHLQHIHHKYSWVLGVMQVVIIHLYAFFPFLQEFLPIYLILF